MSRTELVSASAGAAAVATAEAGSDCWAQTMLEPPAIASNRMKKPAEWRAWPQTHLWAVAATP